MSGALHAGDLFGDASEIVGDMPRLRQRVEARAARRVANARPTQAGTGADPLSLPGQPRDARRRT